METAGAPFPDPLVRLAPSPAHGAPETVEHPGFNPSFAEDFWHLTNMQDFNACESVARALDAGAFCPGPLDYREAGVRRFMGSMARVYQDGALEPAPLIDTAIW